MFIILWRVKGRVFFQMWCAFGGGGLPNPYLLGPVGALIPHLASNTMRLMRSFFEKNNDYAHSLRMFWFIFI